jgi:hypothetical protein
VREGGEKGSGAHSGLGVVGIVQGKLGGGDSTRDRAGAARFRGWRRCFGDWSAGRRKKLVRELQHGDVVLMVLLAKEEKGWNFGSTRNRTAAASEIRRLGVPGCACAERGRRAGQEGAVKCGSASGA